MRALKRRPSPALVISIIALTVAIGGGWAFALPGKDRVNSGDIKKGAVKSSDLRNNGVKGRDVKESSLGRVPSAGAASAPIAYARIDNAASTSPGIIEANSRGVTDANFSDSPNNGIFCITGLPFTLTSISAIADFESPETDVDDIVANWVLGDPFNDCSTPGANAVIYTIDASNGDLDNAGFYVQLWG